MIYKEWRSQRGSPQCSVLASLAEGRPGFLTRDEDPERFSSLIGQRNPGFEPRAEYVTATNENAPFRGR